MQDLKAHTKRFTLDVFAFCDTAPTQPKYGIISRQLMRSAASVAANYRAAQRAQSRRAILAEMAIVEEEAAESLFWLEIFEAMATRPGVRLRHLLVEADHLVAILVASRKTAKKTGSRHH